jgi:hypothetical protein
MKTPTWLGPAAWGAVAGAAAISILGFAQFGWVTGASAERTAQQRAEIALVNLFVPLCVDRFQHQPEAAARMTQLRQVSTWDRRQFVERGGWATIPGSPEPNSPLASACAARLIAL